MGNNETDIKEKWSPHKGLGLEFPCVHAAWFFFVASELRKNGSKMKVGDILDNYVGLGNEMGITFDGVKEAMRTELRVLDFFDEKSKKNAKETKSQ